MTERGEVLYAWLAFGLLVVGLFLFADCCGETFEPPSRTLPPIQTPIEGT